MSKKIDASQLRNLIMEVLAEEDQNEASVDERVGGGQNYRSGKKDEGEHKNELDEADADEGEHKEEGDMNESATLNRWRKLAGILKS